MMTQTQSMKAGETVKRRQSRLQQLSVFVIRCDGVSRGRWAGLEGRDWQLHCPISFCTKESSWSSSLMPTNWSMTSPPRMAITVGTADTYTAQQEQSASHNNWRNHSRVLLWFIYCLFVWRKSQESETSDCRGGWPIRVKYAREIIKDIWKNTCRGMKCISIYQRRLSCEKNNKSI